MCATRILRHRLVVIKKFWISAKLHRREEKTESVCDEDSPSSFSSYKKVWIFPKFRRRDETTGSVCFQWVLKVVGATIDGFLR